MARAGSLSVLAPAKINLYLHVTGRRGDGYHTLDSLVCFADIGDLVTVEDAADFSFTVRGPFAAGFEEPALAAGPDSPNLAVRAAYAIARAARRDLAVKMTLTKNLPIAAGIGGGSADAAAAVWALMERWGLARHAAAYLPRLLRDMGADVPVCFSCQPALMRGIGDELTPLPGLDEMPMLLVNPRVPCPTARVFAHYDGAFRAPAAYDGGDLPSFLRAQDNDLTAAAIGVVPEIAAILAALAAQPGATVARMSGSGATCFALFDDSAAAQAAADVMRAAHPAWWVATGVLNRVARY